MSVLSLGVDDVGVVVSGDVVADLGEAGDDDELHAWDHNTDSWE